MSIAPFKSDQELVSFAEKFFRDRVQPFRKDVAICLTANKKREHAYFPALITCIGFADLLSGLYAGKLEGHGLRELKVYASRFMNPSHYDSLRLEILYLAFRHKLAHLSFPYLVFDTATKPRDYTGKKHRRVTWRVNASKRTRPIELIDYPTPRVLKRSLTPWSVSYDCRVVISVKSFQTDIIKSIREPKGYMAFLRSDPNARERFAKCMRTLYPA